MSNVEQDQEACSPVRDEIDNLIVTIVPMPAIPDNDGIFIAAVAAYDGGKGEITEFLYPHGWGENPKTVKHFLDATAIFTPDFVTPLDISHVALIESATENILSGEPWLFAGDWISHDAVMALFSEKKQKFYYFHCRKCVFQTLNYLMKQQDEWKKTASARVRGNTSLN